MKLFEHPDFEQAIIRAAEYFSSLGIREAIIEKDYYVTLDMRVFLGSLKRRLSAHLPEVLPCK